MADVQQVAAAADLAPGAAHWQVVDVLGDAARQVAHRAQELAMVADGGMLVGFVDFDVWLVYTHNVLHCGLFEFWGGIDKF